VGVLQVAIAVVSAVQNHIVAANDARPSVAGTGHLTARVDLRRKTMIRINPW
jgi:hypothetical protein